MDRIIKLVEVDFNKPWYYPIRSYKITTILIFLNEISSSIFNTLSPLILTLAISNLNFNLIYLFFILYVILELFNRFTIWKEIGMVYSIKSSISYASLKFFLTVDPIFHSLKSSGQIISKINRSTNSYMQILFTFKGSILPTIISLLTAVSSLLFFSWQLGFLTILSFLIIGFISYLIVNLGNIGILPIVLKKEAKSDQTNLENLQQNNYIRSIFATSEQLKKTKERMIEAEIWQGNLTMNFGFNLSFSRIAVTTLVTLVALQILILIQAEEISTDVGIGLLLTFSASTQSIISIGRIINSFFEALGRVQDLFQFIRDFGKQTFPVLPGDKVQNLTENS